MDQPGYGTFRERREASVWQRLNRILRALLVLAFLLIVVSLFLPQHKTLLRSQAEIDALHAQVIEQKMLLVQKTREVALLKSDPGYLETIARDQLDMMKEGETIFRFEKPPASKRK